MRTASVVFWVFIILGAAAFCSRPALAFNQNITVYAVVPAQREIIVNPAGYITKVIGNTSQNITPTVYDQSYHTLAMTDSVQRQYDQLLRDHHNRLEAGQTYEVNPVSVINTPDTRILQINTVGLKLGSDRTG